MHLRLKRSWQLILQVAVSVALTYFLCGAALALVLGFPIALALYAAAFVYVASGFFWSNTPRSPWILSSIAPVFFVVSSMYCLLVATGAALAAPFVLAAELKGAVRAWSTVRYLCLCWLAVVTPTFGVMALLLARRWHFELPGGSTLGIWLGFSYTAVYDFFIPSPELYEWDHPFPPLTNAELDVIGVSVLAVAAVAAYVLVRTSRPSAT